MRPSKGTVESLGPDYSVDQVELLARAQRALSARPRPFLRWAGSKRALLTHLVPLLPETFKTYREPFMGSASLFFLLRPGASVLSDSCEELVGAFAAVRDDVDRVIRWLEGKKPDRAFYYRLRSDRSDDPAIRAAELIYLNKTCWNGLYRVNTSGVFNVPFGKPKTDAIADLENLKVCSSALQSTQVRCSDFEDALEGVEAGDLVFLDPPYVTGHSNNGFVDYNERLFSWHDQMRLAQVAQRLVDNEATVIVTNAAHERIVDLYQGFVRHEFSRSSTLASDPKRRGRVSEMIFVGTPRKTKRQRETSRGRSRPSA